MNFRKLPWETSSLIPNFVPSFIKLFNYDKCSVFVAWRKSECLVLNFPQPLVDSDSVHPPTSSQILQTSEAILDVLEIDNRVYIVNVKGLIQALQPIRKRPSDKDQFCLVDIHQLSPLRSILAVCGCNLKNGLSSSEKTLNFCAVTCGNDYTELYVEGYSVSRKSQSKTDFQLVSVQNISIKTSIKFATRSCVVVWCNKHLVKALFHDYDGFEVFLVGLSSGHLFCVTFKASTDQKGLCPSPRLIFQSPMAVSGVFCSEDGNAVFLLVDGGIFVTITSSCQTEIIGNSTPLSFSTITLPCTMKHACACRSNLILCSNGIDMWQFDPLSSNSSNVLSLSLKGVAALHNVTGTSLILVATVFCVLYELKASSEQGSLSQKNESHNLQVWSDKNLDRNLQYVREMKQQTDLLAHLRIEQEKEDSIITALSTAARASLLTELFTMSVKVDMVNQSSECSDVEQDPFSTNVSEIIQEYCFSIEIHNNSSEEFSPSMWGICVEIENPSGIIFAKNISLSRSFSIGAPFLNAVSVSLSPVKITFPMNVKVYLMSCLTADSNALDNHWSIIPLKSTSIDISYFITVTMKAPQLHSCLESDLSVLIRELNWNKSNEPNRNEIQHTEKITHTIYIPESVRQIPLLVDKLFENCQHRIQKDALEKYLMDRHLECPIWIGAKGNFVQATFKRSCTSLSISSNNVELLHEIKSWIVNVLLRIASKNNITSVAVKAKNLKAVLQIQNTEDEDSSKNLLTLYQDLRNSVSSEVL